MLWFSRVAGTSILLAGLASLAATTPSRAADPPPTFQGPAFGDNRYTTTIASFKGQPDVDDYVSALRAGEALTVSVSPGRHSSLQPVLRLIGPDGAPVETIGKAGRRGASFRGFVVPATGRWTVRVSGANSTEGEYTVAFAVKVTRPLVLHKQQLGDGEPVFKIHTFPGLDGALLDFRLRWTRRSLPVDLRSFTDPQGDEVLTPGGKLAKDQVATKASALSFTRLVLHEGDGDYSMRVRIPQGVATYDLRFAVDPQGRPKGRRPVVLAPLEPFLEPLASATRGRAGFSLRLDGANFSTNPHPSVFFGTTRGTITSVASDGTSIVVTVPQGVPGTATSVAVVNPDGQASVRPDYFFYLQPIEVHDLVDEAGVPARVGSTRGGLTLRLTGAFFEPGQIVKFGNFTATVVSVPSPEAMIILTPAALPGDVPVTVTDSFGGIATSAFVWRYKAPPTFAAKPYSPSVASVNTQVEVTITGKDFEAADQLSFDGAVVPSTFVSSTTRRFTVPALPKDDYAVSLKDSIGSVEQGPAFSVTPGPEITAVSIVAGPVVGVRGVPVAGGSTIQVDGTEFHSTDTVTLGGAAVTAFLSHTKTRFTFASPPGTLGDASLTVTDGAAQSATYAQAVRFVGFTDATSARSPGANATDNLVADRGVVGDLDRDGVRDDVVLITAYGALGTRTELTRLFFGNSSGKLVDKTATNFPRAGTDSSRSDNWSGTAVALGDVDAANGADILIAGFAPYSYVGGTYKSIRLFKNNGQGSFALDEASSPPQLYTAATLAVDQSGSYYVVYGTIFESGAPRAMALGDLDSDGLPDLVVGRDHYDFRYVGVDPATVNFAVQPPYVNSTNLSYLSVFEYISATKVFVNELDHGLGFVDRTGTAMPGVGDSTTFPVPCFQAQDVALGDIDRDGDLDIVECWDDPTTVSAYGTYSGANTDIPRTATRVLRNNGSAVFTDVTASWMPLNATPEFRQATRLALADLDKDGDADLVLVHAQSLNAFLGGTPTFTQSALRVLRNDSNHFTDVTSSALPALPGNGDNFRGVAVAVRDVDGDSWADIVVGTNEALADPVSSAAIRSTRLFRGHSGLAFTADTPFLPAPATDTGEANDILLGDLAGSADPSLILVSAYAPTVSPNAQTLRIFNWNR